jgi:broad specificity phosphatase PhoE
VTRLVLCRHGEAEGAAGRFCGSFDPALSAAGRRQAQSVRVVVGESALYSSPALRALETARATGREPIVEPDLRELDFGEADGLRYEEAGARWPALYAEWLRAPTRVCFPGGEAFSGFRTRALAVVARVQMRHPDAAVVVVTHAGVIRTLLAHWLSIPEEALFRLDQSYGCINIVDWADGSAIVRRVNGSPRGTIPGE